MTRRRPLPASPPSIGLPQVSPEVGIELIQKQIDKAEQLLKSRIEEHDYEAWTVVTSNILGKAFGTNSPNIASVINAGPGGYRLDGDDEWWANYFAEKLRARIAVMKGLIELLTTDIEIEKGAPPKVTSPLKGHEIFLAHGRDHGILNEVARFLEKLQQKVLVLRELPNQGRTIIEKIDEYSDAGFAIVLLTPDDQGGVYGEPIEKQMPRARQNVIFELGFFIGRLGRNRVCALYFPGVEIPTNYSGVLFIQYDTEGAWCFKLAKEIRAVGIPVDLNFAC